MILEEYAEKENAEQNPDIVDISVDLHIHSLWNNSVVENWDHYNKSMKQLIRTMPNLKIIRPVGGHSFNYRNGVRYLSLRGLVEYFRLFVS